MTRIEQLYASDRIARDLGLELLAHTDHSVRLAVTIDDRHIGWHGRCHGGVLFTMADIAMSYLGNRFPAMAYATHASIEFLGGVDPGDRLEVEATETVRRGRAAVCDVDLRVGTETVAVFRGATLQSRPAASAAEKDRRTTS